MSTREMLHNYINILSNEDVNRLFKMIIELSPTDEPLPDEIEAIAQSENDEYISAEDFNWE
ncbi:MAG TPA: hypothetical protein DIW26_08135 [Ruminococcus sp.]|nr:hypothetical protein [Ruminococcus sp.]